MKMMNNVKALKEQLILQRKKTYQEVFQEINK